jgi:hypothetical protein
MGCQQSTPTFLESDTERMFTHNVSKVKRTAGGTERLISSSKRKNPQQQAVQIPPRLDADGQLMPEEFVKRAVCSPENRNVKLGNPDKGNVVRMQYAYWTQRGWYPDGKQTNNMILTCTM